ncbi:MAG: Polysaccharide biosynthesis protein CapD [Parcubacteria group bacterium GW2011_GWA2_49_9]|nr:MAG: Polysaccharide biosynthesis protein CapD [Parcubacteria group bacterium GW2011_GWA2_49_9]
MTNQYTHKCVFVTGGTGSIGWQIVLEALRHRPKEVVVYSRDETAQFERKWELPSDAAVRFVIGDIRDKERLHEAMRGSHIVFHAAALKHVPICESNPSEAVKTNVVGTQNVIDCALEHNVEKVIGISTDKAANASNVLGSTKFLAEKLMRATNLQTGDRQTKFCFVRFGNVLGSRGSVVPLFVAQAKAGGPLTITDPAMTRFFMTLPQAVTLIFKAAQLVRNREIFILKMPTARMGDLAQAVISLVVPLGTKRKNIAIRVIGIREGERTHEVMLSYEESRVALETDDMFILLPDSHSSSEQGWKQSYPSMRPARIGAYESQKEKTLSVADLKKMLEQDNVLRHADL